jgi:hypothetical protein
MKFMRKGSKVSIEEVDTSHGLEYNIVFDGGNDSFTVAKCWDYLLAEKLRDATSEYMAEEYKVVGQEDAEAMTESFDEPIMPDKAVAGKPIAAKVVYEEDPRQSFIIHSKRQCKDKWEDQAFQYVMLTGKAYEDEFGIMVPVLQRGVPKKYKELLSRRFPVSLEEID